MPSHAQVAAKIRADKEAHPENYCPVPKCLWKSYGLHCPNHQPKGGRGA